MGFIERRGYAHDENCSCSYCQKERQKKERQEQEGEKAQAVERANYILRTEANKVRIRKEIEEKLSHNPPEKLVKPKYYYQGPTDENWAEPNFKTQKTYGFELTPTPLFKKIWKKIRSYRHKI
jgi:hypothetical protein